MGDRSMQNIFQCSFEVKMYLLNSPPPTPKILLNSPPYSPLQSPTTFCCLESFIMEMVKLACFFALVVANMVGDIQMINHISYSILGLLRASMPFLLVIISLSSTKGFCVRFSCLMQLHSDIRYYSI